MMAVKQAKRREEVRLGEVRPGVFTRTFGWIKMIR